MDELLEAIERYQQRQGLSDTKFSREVGLDGSTLSKIKSGQRQPGVRVLKKLSQVPELRAVCAKYLAGGGHPEPGGNGRKAGVMSRVKSIFRR